MATTDRADRVSDDREQPSPDFEPGVAPDEFIRGGASRGRQSFARVDSNAEQAVTRRDCLRVVTAASATAALAGMCSFTVARGDLPGKDAGGDRRRSGTTGTAAVDLHQALELAREDRADDPACREGLAWLAEHYGTPLYVYDRATIEARFAEVQAAFRAAFPRLRIFYALKANTQPAIVGLLCQKGAQAGAEVVSVGEIDLARRCGVPGSEILFTSSSKSPDEIARAVDEGAVLNIDSLDELEQVAAAAEAAGSVVRVSFRVNPDVDPHTIHPINTGIASSKFGLSLQEGIARSAFERALQRPSLRVCGAHCHIGSQITEPAGYVQACGKMFDLARELKDRLGLKLPFIDLGGGFGIPYRDGERVMTPAELVEQLAPAWRRGVAALGYEPELWIEPGRYFVAASGFLLTRVNSVKPTPTQTFVNVDAGFNTLARPAMYQAYHRARVVGRRDPLATVQVAGNVCETGDILAADRQLPLPQRGDLIALLDAGAYGFTMASQYNARPLPAEVLVDGQSSELIRARGAVQDLWPPFEP